MGIASYKDLDVWKKGLEIVDRVYELTEAFPKQESFGLVIQMQRSAISIPSNIAEGFARQHSKEYKQFLYIAHGSCAELDTQITVADRRKYVSQQKAAQLQEDLDHESRMLMCLIKKL